MSRMKSQLCLITPFEVPDVALAVSAQKAGFFPILHLGRDPAAATDALDRMAKLSASPFGVCIANAQMACMPLPAQASVIVAPWGTPLPPGAAASVAWQAHDADEAREALTAKAGAIIIKGSEGAGACGEESSFILFQKLAAPCKAAGVKLYIQGGVGVHTGAAYLALGASGLVFDSQAALMPDCGAAPELKAMIGRLGGNEIRSCEGFRYYIKPGLADPGESGKLGDLIPSLGASPNSGAVPLGQDAVIAQDFADQFKTLGDLARALLRSAHSHAALAKERDCLGPGSALALDLGTDLSIAQGPMARVSDVPEFLRDISDAGAMPFLAMGMMTGQKAEDTLMRAAEAMGGRPWGVGILGFIYPRIMEEQGKLIAKAKPTALIIGGGRPSQSTYYKREGIKVFLHVPSPSLLDMFIKENARMFVFEGRESGGHVGPLYSTVLWEKQINRLLKFDNPASISAYFAGGIHDELSAAFVRIAAAPLAARDAKVGVVAGTAYLFSDEAVARGAITEGFRQTLMEKGSTVLLKSGAGQETRAVPTPYTKFFQDEKERLLAGGGDQAKAQLRLEEMNLGRLRIASKGVERRGDEIVAVSPDEQARQGLFMAGEVASMVTRPTTVAQIHKALAQGSLQLLRAAELPQEPEPPESPVPAVDIAVVGMACVFPDAADIDEYWRNILFGRDCMREVPPERWSTELFFDQDAKDTDHVVSKWGGFVGESDFDPLEFGITPQSLASIEPTQLLSLLIAKRALEDAGYTDLSKVDLDDTSVVFGAQGAAELATMYGARAGLRALFGDLPPEADEALPKLTEDSFPGVLGNVISGRISNRLNTGGRNFTVDAACASSLAALDIAYSELATGKANMVVCGGSDMSNGINSFLMFSSTYALSRKGRCSTFDSEADGIALGEGIGVAILKRLADAERDGNKIYAVIKGIGGSSDGKILGLTAPSRTGQVKALVRAYENARVLPSQVGLIEAHGTGTVVGDRIEMSSLNDVFLDAGAPPRRTRLGSVKTQIGHTKCAAGVASLIKAVLCVQHGLLPPTLHLCKPNDSYTKGSPFSFRTEKTGFWNERTRIAGISAFGFGGTNFHAVVESYKPEPPPAPLGAWPAELYVFRGDTPDEAKELMGKVKALLAINDKLKPKDIAGTLAAHSSKPVQFAVVADGRERMLSLVDGLMEGAAGDGAFARAPVEGKVAFLFSGQGSQRVDMAADLFLLFPGMRRLLGAHPEFDGILFPDSAFTEGEKKAQGAAITDTRNAQPLLGIVDLAIAELLRGLGIEPDMAAGHSYGELPALCFAGAFDSERLVPLSRARAEAILAAAGSDPGRMAAVMADADTVAALLEGVNEAWAVNYNAPKQIAVAGTDLGIEAFLKKLDGAKVPYSELNVACAFHSPILAGAEAGFAEALAGVEMRAPGLPVWSNTTAEAYPCAPEAIKGRLAEHLVSPVQFTREIERMHEDGARVFIEAGPGGTLCALAGRILKGKEGGIATIQTEQGGADGLAYFLRALARYICTGREVAMDKLFENRGTRTLSIDEPERHKKSPVVWNVNGQMAKPGNGDPPPYVSRMTGGPIMPLDQYREAQSAPNPDNVMLAYLTNVNAMIQDQRDVMLGYFGQPAMPRATMAQAQAQAQAQAIDAADGALAVGASAAAAVAAAEPEVVDTPGSGKPSIMDVSSDEIQEMLLDLISEKTGYPVDMLGLDVDLAAELSIDSIKKMEIIGGLQERVEIPEAEGDMDEYFEKIIAIKTIRQLVAWIEELKEAFRSGAIKAKSEGEEFKGANVLIGQPAEAAEETTGIVRLTLALEPMPAVSEDASAVKGKAFAITDTGDELSVMLAAALEERGAKAMIVSKGAESIDGADGLVLVCSASAPVHYTAMDLFRLIKLADIEKLRMIYTFDDVPASLRRSKALTKVKRLEGFTGFIKTLCHEYTGKRMSAVTFRSPVSQKAFVKAAVGELLNEHSYPEVIYRDGARCRQMPAITPQARADAEGMQALELGPEANVMVLGGAQGISPGLVARLAERWPCRYILVGRTPATGDKSYAGFETRDDIRRHLIQVEGMKHPKEIEAKVNAAFKANQLAKALDGIEKAGAKACYHSVDVTDQKAFKAFIAQARAEYGTIDGVVHAAGVIEDRLFRDKELDSFRRVYETKVAPLQAITKELLPELKLLVMFSSMTAAFGNPGQADYAAANSVLDELAEIVGEKFPQIRTVAFDWGPWKGAGMVDAGLENMMKKRGIALLQFDQGREFYANELAYGKDAHVLAIAGSERKIEGFIKTALEHESEILEKVESGILEKVEPGILEKVEPGILEKVEPGILEKVEPGIPDNEEPGIPESMEPEALENMEPEILEKMAPAVLEKRESEDA